MKLEFAHICDTAFATENTKNLNIIGIFEKINASNFPVVHPSFSLVAGTKGEPGIHRKKFKIINKDNGNIIVETQDSEFVITEGTDKGYFANKFMGVVFPEAGNYKIEIIIDDNPVGSVDFSVRSQ